MSEKVVYQLFELITVIFEAFIVQQYINGFFERCVKTRYAFLGYSLFCIGLSFLSLFYRLPIILVCYTVLGVFLLEYYLYSGNILTKFFIAFFFGVLMISSEIICVGIVSTLGEINLEDSHKYGLPRALMITVVKLVQILVVKILGILVKRRRGTNDNIEIKGALFLVICQALSIILSYNIFMTAYNTDGNLTTTVLLSISAIIYINIIVFWYFDKIKTAYEYKHEKELVETKLEFQNEYYELLDEYQQETEALWHDMKKHISAIKELYQQDLKFNTERYINALDDKINDIPKIVRTSIPAINAILVDGLRKATKENIDVRLDINISQDTIINDFDLCVLLGNTLENAINACCLLPKGDKRYINVSILQSNSLMLIDVKNPFISSINAVSQKERKHGYGLKNVRKVVKKYGGYIKIHDTYDIFHVSLIIP